jgi:hypothetical protein
MILLVSASQVAGITGMYHRTGCYGFFLLHLKVSTLFSTALILTLHNSPITLVMVFESSLISQI